MQVRRFRLVVPVLVLFAVFVPLDASVFAAGQWRTIHNQTFEGTFPGTDTGWIAYDGSYTSSQGIWGKGAGGFNSAFAAHPRSGLTPYDYNTHTWMRYGPFSLAGATDARMLFKYWMQTEAGYDTFSWDYSCNGVDRWTGRTLSGFGPGTISAWASSTFSLKPCVGKTQVYVQFTFNSDQSVNYQGVWVDNVKIQKFS
jgi:Immune inhibitor A-like, MAM domain